MDEESGPSAATAAGPITDGPAHELVGARPERSTALWLKLLVFGAGIVVGLLVVGLLDVTTPDFATARGAGGPVPAGSQPGPGRSVPPGAEIRVNAACLGVLNEAQDVYAVLGDLGDALDAVDLTALDDVVRRLQPVEPRLQQDLRDCRVGAAVGPGEASAAPTAPLTTPPPVQARPSPTR